LQLGPGENALRAFRIPPMPFEVSNVEAEPFDPSFGSFDELINVNNKLFGRLRHGAVPYPWRPSASPCLQLGLWKNVCRPEELRSMMP
jgi:hypothetical protein